MFMKRIGVAALVAGFALAATQASAADHKLNITWSGASFGNDASATGYIVFDDNVVPQLGDSFELDISKLIDLSITVSGAAAGNGTFGKNDFSSFYFWSPAPLDLSRELIGQEMGGDAVYGDLDGPGGDFNLFREGGEAPNGTYFFTLTTAGGEEMRVTSMAPGGVPEPASWMLMIGGFGLVGASMRRRQRAQVSFG